MNEISQKHDFKNTQSSKLKGLGVRLNNTKFLPLVLMPDVSSSSVGYVFKQLLENGVTARYRDNPAKLKYLGITELPLSKNLRTSEAAGLEFDLASPINCLGGKCNIQEQLVLKSPRVVGSSTIPLFIHKEPLVLDFEKMFPDKILTNLNSSLPITESSMLYPKTAIIDFHTHANVLWEDENGTAIGWTVQLLDKFSEMHPQTAGDLVRSSHAPSLATPFSQAKNSTFSASGNVGIEFLKKRLTRAMLKDHVLAL